ncbi:MAG: HU family DNA-binding protein [Tannerellaceae bacterium]|jgi:predicted histone-like DNA-binding protein|nr:HU family DNA-binding protein [Tannerellaceae bacterium]
MGLFYDFYQNPPEKGSDKKPRLHARVVTSGTIHSDEIAKQIHEMSTLTTGEVQMALSMFGEQLLTHLSSSHRVHWKGVGYFELALSCPPVCSTKEIRAESIHPKTIVFRPEKKLKETIKRFPLTRTPEKRHSSRHSEAEIDGLLTRHFSNYPYITGIQFRQLCSFTHSTASRHLKRLVTEGKLQTIGHRRSPLYEPVEGHYHR